MIGVDGLLRSQNPQGQDVDGSVTGVHITQRSGISALDISAQRAVMDASPFAPLPPQFPKNDAEIEFLFQLKE